MTSAGAAAALAAAVAGCAAGVGPYQPRRDAYATAGVARPDLVFDDADRRAAHQRAKQQRVPELGGGDTAMYAFDGGGYLGVKQGVSQTRRAGGAWSASTYAFEGHATLLHALLDDRLVAGATAFAVGYGTGDGAARGAARYLGVGGELIGKVGLTTALALRATAGRMLGQERIDDGAGQTSATAGAWRATGGLDWAASRLHGNDLVVTAELQAVRAATVDARALMFELTLAGI